MWRLMMDLYRAGRDARPALNCDYSMLEPSGWYLYFLPSQKTTEVA
jgi:hypothetical protein